MTDFRITLSSPDVVQQDIDAVVKVLESQWLCLGPKICGSDGLTNKTNQTNTTNKTKALNQSN